MKCEIYLNFFKKKKVSNSKCFQTIQHVDEWNQFQFFFFFYLGEKLDAPFPGAQFLLGKGSTASLDSGQP